MAYFKLLLPVLFCFSCKMAKNKDAYTKSLYGAPKKAPEYVTKIVYEGADAPCTGTFIREVFRLITRFDA